jgi:hypothetical protein
MSKGGRRGPDGEREPGAAPRSEEELRDREGLRGRLEGMVPEILKRAMLSGLGAISVTEETIRGAVTDMKLPKEAVAYLLEQADSTKDQFLALVAREIREFLTEADLGQEIARALSSMHVEVNMRIGFVPNENLPDRVKPVVESEVSVKRRRKKRDAPPTK